MARPRESVRPVMITVEAPRLTKWIAASRPRPLVAPVMRIVWSLKVSGGGRDGGNHLPWRKRKRIAIVDLGIGGWGWK